MALGTDRRAVTGLIVREGAWMVGVGVVVGTAVAYLSRDVLASFVFGVPTSDRLTFATAIAGVCLVAVMTASFAARRAASVDPVIGLREE